MVDLVIKPSSLGPKDKPFALCLRYHDLSGTDYAPLVHINEETAREIMRAGVPRWLYGDPIITPKDSP